MHCLGTCPHQFLVLEGFAYSPLQVQRAAGSVRGQGCHLVAAQGDGCLGDLQSDSRDASYRLRESASHGGCC